MYFRDIIPVKNSIILWEAAPSWSEMHIWTDVFKLHLRLSTYINSEQVCVDLKCIKRGIWRRIKSEQHLRGSRLELWKVITKNKVCVSYRLDSGAVHGNGLHVCCTKSWTKAILLFFQKIVFPCKTSKVSCVGRKKWDIRHRNTENYRTCLLTDNTSSCGSLLHFQPYLVAL